MSVDWGSVNWISDVVVPVAAILVSAFIAVGLARRERHRAEQDRLRAATGEVVRALVEMSRAAATGRQADAEAAFARFQGDLSVLGGHLKREQMVIPQFCVIVIFRAIGAKDARALVETTLWLANVLGEWGRGAVKTSDFAREMPEDTKGAWASGVDLADWADVITGAPPRGTSPPQA